MISFLPPPHLQATPTATFFSPHPQFTHHLPEKSSAAKIPLLVKEQSVCLFSSVSYTHLHFSLYRNIIASSDPLDELVEDWNAGFSEGIEEIVLWHPPHSYPPGIY